MAEQYYLGNPLLKKPNTPLEFTQEQLVEFAKCAADPVYFAKNYIKIVNIDDGLVNFDMWPFQEKMLRTFHENRFSICKLPRQPLENNTPIPTLDGYKKIKDLKIGQFVYDLDGNPTKIINKVSYTNTEKCYKLSFKGKNFEEDIICDKDHLWKVYINNERKVLTAEQIYDIKEEIKLKRSSFSTIIEHWEEDILLQSIEEVPSTKVSCIEVENKDHTFLCGKNFIPTHNCGKCFSYNTIIKVKKKSIKEALEIKIGDFYNKLIKTNDVNIINSSKIIEEILTDEWEVETPSGWQSFSGVGKTVEYVEWEIVTELGNVLICADKHILLDKNWNKIYCEDLTPGNLIQTKNGIEKIKSVRKTENSSHMYDLLDVENGNIFYSNNIVSHNSTTAVSFLLHYAIFNDNVSIAILANKASTAKDLLGRLQTSYENLPRWLQQGIKSFNKMSMELENGSKIITASTSASSVRGGSYNIIFLDEFAFVPNTVALNFMNSVYPTISSGKDSKVIMVSTPNGMNHFYKMWDEAVKKENDYIPIEILWNDVPGRDEEWKRKTIANLGSTKSWLQEFECSFLGSSDTLISGVKLQTLVTKKPIKVKNHLDTYEEPIPDHQYAITADVARGIGEDYSAFVVIDITEMPYKVVAKYRNNEIKPIMFPYVVKDVGLHYNKAFVLCETNDIGGQVANALHYDLDYPNLLSCFIKGRKGQIVGQGFGGTKVEFGVKMSANVKKIGSLNLKMLIEEDKLLFYDYDILNELSTFVQKSNTFMAEEGKNDDLVMCLLIFAWLTTNEYFKEITDSDIRKRLFQEKMEKEEDDVLPIGFLETGIQEQTFVQEDKLWEVVPLEEMLSLWSGYNF